MKKLVLALMLVLAASSASAQITVTNSFSTGQVITAAAMNTNFQTDLGNNALDRTGGTITGNIVVDNNITIDGVDVSDYLATNVYAQDSGAAGDPSFSWVGDTDNGMFLGGTNIVDFATAGSARVRIAADGTVAINSTDASALDVAGGLNIGSGNVALVDATGQITSLDTEYLVDLSAEDLTTLNASALSSGTVATARLGSGTASSSTFLRGDGSWQAVTAGVAGSDTQVQYNNGGALGGDSGFTFDDSANAVTITGTAANSLDIGGGLNAGTGNVGVINAAGKIPAISSTYFASLALAASNLTGCCRVLQIVEGTTTTDANTASGTYADTNLTAAITPASTDNKILVIVTQNGVVAYDVGGGGPSATGMDLKLLRDATDIGLIVGDGANAYDNEGSRTAAFVELDSPSSTSALTYKTQYRVASGGDSDSRARVQVNSAESKIILIEIGY
jgi:hypothetical protein